MAVKSNRGDWSDARKVGKATLGTESSTMALTPSFWPVRILYARNNRQPWAAPHPPKR